MRPSTTSPRQLGRRRRLVAALGAGALLLAACGGDDGETGDESAATTAPGGTTEETDAPSTEDTDTPSTDDGAATDSTASDTTTGGTADTGDGVEGCGEDSATDPADLSEDREVARCDPGAPAPQPLDEPAEITVTTSFTAEFVAPLLLAQEYGEFEKENLTVTVETLAFSDALTQMETGRVDVAVGGAEAGWYNAVDRGIAAKWILGNYVPPDASDTSVPQTGLWVRNEALSDPSNPDLSELEGARVASAVGLGSVIAYPIAEAFAEYDMSLLDLQVETIPSTDMVTALQNGAVDAAWLLDPYWIEAAESGDLTLVATQTPGEPLGGYFASPSVYEEQPEVGEAFARAMIRTINTHLAGDYVNDEQTVQDLSNVTDTPVESLQGTGSLLFDWEIREGTTEATQEYFIDFETVEYDEPIPEEELVDRSLYLAAVGQEE